MATQTPQQVIQTFMQALANHKYTEYTKTIGVDILNDAITASSNFASAQNVIDNMKADQISAEREAVEEILGSEYAGMTISQINSKILRESVSNYVSGYSGTATVRTAIYSRKTNIFLEKYCGINLGNDDTGAISGSDANITLKAGDVVYGKTVTSAQTIGSGTEKTASSIVPEDDANETFDTSTKESFSTTSGLTFTLLGYTNKSGSNDKKNFRTATYEALTDDEKVIYEGLSKWWGEECTKLINDTYGLNFKSDVANDISVIFYDSGGSGNTLAMAGYSYGSDYKGKDLRLLINMAFHKGISRTDEDGMSTSDRSFYIDRTLAHELTHSVMEANINYFGELPQFVKEGMAELTHGIDDERGLGSKGIYELASDSSKLSKGLKLKDTGTLTMECYSGGFMFFRYFAKQASLMSFADYGGADSNGGTWAIKGTTATYSIGGEVKATLKDLRAGLAVTGTQINGITVDGTKITLSQKVLGTSTVSLGKKDNFTLELDDEMSEKTVKLNEAAWTLKKGTATLKSDTTAGYSESGDGKSIIYSKAAAGKAVATISGLSKVDGDVSVADLPDPSDKSDTVITLTSKMLGTSKKVTLKSDIYSLTTDGTIDMVEEIDEPYWTVKGTTAIYQTGMTAGFELKDSKTLVYTKEKTSPIATISGLRAGLSADDFADIDMDGDTITLPENVLGTSNITLKSDKYKLAIASTALSPQKGVNTLSVSGTKAIYKNVDTGYFTVKTADKAYKYNKEKVNETYATVTGIRKNASASAFTVDAKEKTITLTADAMPESPKASTKITLGKKDDFTLKLDEGVAKAAYADPAWSYNKGKAIYGAAVNSAGYNLSSDGKTITYTPDKDKKGNTVTSTLATVSGLSGSKGLTVEGNIILVPAALLNGKKVTLAKTDDFTFATNASPPIATSQTWASKNGTAKLTAQMSAGYTISEDGRSINYSKAGAKVVAQISGANKELTAESLDSSTEFDSVFGSITLSKDQLTDKVTIGGTEAFVFAADYKGATITGSSAADNITILGVNNTIKAGKGDDILSSNGGNTFLYANGDGNDIFESFKDNVAGDEIKITKGTFSVTADDEDALITVGKGSIRLAGLAGKTIYITDSRNFTKGYVATPEEASTANYAPETVNDLLYSDNYELGSELGDLISGNDINDFSVAEVETNISSDLTEQKQIITYSDDK